MLSCWDFMSVYVALVSTHFASEAVGVLKDEGVPATHEFNRICEAVHQDIRKTQNGNALDAAPNWITLTGHDATVHHGLLWALVFEAPRVAIRPLAFLTNPYSYWSLNLCFQKYAESQFDSGNAVYQPLRVWAQSLADVRCPQVQLWIHGYERPVSSQVQLWAVQLRMNETRW